MLKRKRPQTFDRLRRCTFWHAGIVALFAVILSGCTELQQPKVEPFYAETVPPPKQELRWSNGKTPSSLDPAFAAAAPETDIIRAAYEGLTELDNKSLRETPGVAERWESSPDLKTWKFFIRKDAQWSNGESLKASDFVASWKRLVALREKAANRHLFQNIVGMRSKAADDETELPTDFLQQTPPENTVSGKNLSETELLPKSQISLPLDPTKQPPIQSENKPQASTTAPKFGVEAIDDHTLGVNLILPDKDFPKLVSNPIFRPVYKAGNSLEPIGIDSATVTNGAFKVTKVGDEGVSLERSDNYWNAKAVALERLRFVAAKSAEIALDSYKKGDIDVITNASFEPLALKILTPYEDFRRTTHSALNFYAFNETKAPFNDRRVREAMAIAIDRAKLTEGDLEGMNQPAFSFFPLGEARKETLTLDTVKAKQLLEKAGFPDGEGFPAVRLVINRNDIQQRVAKSVARMWKQNLNIDTLIEIKEAGEIEEIRKTGDYDLIRSGVVLPANDELVNIESVLGSAEKTTGAVSPETTGENERVNETDDQALLNVEPQESIKDDPAVEQRKELSGVLTEADVMYELKIIPLYFPKSYALVKPYVLGFEMNALDAHSLKEVSIDNNWRTKVR